MARGLRRADRAAVGLARLRALPAPGDRGRGAPGGGGRMDPRVTGAQRYSVEVERPGMLHAAFVRSPHAARARAGGRRVGRRPRRASCSRRTTSPTSASTAARSRTSACSPTARATPGDVVAAVAAPTREAARDGRQGSSRSPTRSCPRSSTRWRRSAAARRSCTRSRPRRPSDAVSIDVRPIPNSNVCHRFRIRHGDVAAGFAEADVVVEEVYRTAGAAHAPMEPHAALAEWEDGRLTVWPARRPRSTRAPTSPGCSASPRSASA